MPPGESMLKATTNKNLCPFLNEPFDDCYCVKMSSQDIERAIYLCSKNFKTCDIYKKGNGNTMNHMEKESVSTTNVFLD